MLADLDLFSTKLGKLDGFSDAGDYLKGIVQAKEVKTPEPSTSTQETKAEDDTVAEAESKTSAGTEEAPTNESDKAEEKKSDDS
jgi:vacuolar protein sorting-associated protein 54